MKHLAWQIGASACGHEDMTRELFEEYQKAQIGFMEISLCFNCRGLEVIKEIYSRYNVKNVRKYAEETGVDIWSYHLPFDHNFVNPASFDAAVRKQTIEIDNMMIEDAAEVGAKYAIIHASGEPIEDSDRADSMKYAKETILTLNETAKKNGIVLAVECLPRTCLGKNSSEVLELVEGDDALKVCFDVNHLLCESHKDFVKNIGSKIETLHISDYDFVDERHWLPGKGKIDWEELVSLLKGIGYNGVFMNEVACKYKNSGNDEWPTYDELRETNEKVLIR